MLPKISVLTMKADDELNVGAAPVVVDVRAPVTAQERQLLPPLLLNESLKRVYFQKQRILY